ncbi:hypothetical protein ACHAW5_010031 [Stephanodiscus triporus]|uniref:Condensin complex subunit 2 n=1 Tax=Stephanodiscus triporus TaxID=2934178 RepID=A0ABD3N5X3_9STRA
MANASKIKPAKVRFAAADDNEEAELSRDEGGSLIPQLHCAALAAREANDDPPDDFDSFVADVSTTKMVPLGRHDSLHRTCGVATAGEICNLGLLGHIANDDGDPVDNLLYDDIDEAINLTNIAGNVSEVVDAVDGIEDMIRHAAAAKALRGDDTEAATADTDEILGNANAVHAKLNPFNMKHMERRESNPGANEVITPHDILKDIEAAAEMRESFTSFSSEEKYPEKVKFDSNRLLSTELFESSSNDGQEARNITQLEPEEEEYDILDAINEVARGTGSTNIDTTLPGFKSISRLNVVPPSILRTTTRCTTSSPVGNVDDYLTMKSADLKPDSPSYAYGSTNNTGGCGSNILQQTREILPSRLVCRKQDPPVDGERPSLSSSSKKKKKWNLFSSGNPDTAAIVSDDEEHNRTDDEDEDDMAIRRPWKEKLDDDRYANYNQRSSSRSISPWCSDGSNYDPDSDWDVDDNEVESISYNEDIFEAKSRTRNKDKDASPLRIW